MKDKYMLNILALWASYCTLLVRYQGELPKETGYAMYEDYKYLTRTQFSEIWGEISLPRVIAAWFAYQGHPLITTTLNLLQTFKTPRTTKGTVWFFEDLTRQFEIVELNRVNQGLLQEVPEHIYEVELNREYVSNSTRTKVKVLGFCKHAQDCSVGMVRFTNLSATVDAPAGTEWVLEESIFLKRFKECV